MSLKIFETTSNTYSVGPASTVLYEASGLTKFILIQDIFNN